MPQFCLVFYAILQSWRPKGGAWHNDPPYIRSCPCVLYRGGHGALQKYRGTGTRYFVKISTAVPVLSN